MYTVIRFYSDAGDHDLESWGAELNTIMPGMYEGMSKVPGQFSCSVCWADDWWSHRDAICDFIRNASAVVRRARRSGVGVQLDTAVCRDDYANRSILEMLFDIELMKLLVDSDVSIAVSFYPST